MTISRKAKPELAYKMEIRYPRTRLMNLTMLVSGALFSLGLIFGGYYLGRQSVLGTQQGEKISELLSKVEQLKAERDHMTQTANTIESKVNIDKSMQTQLADQVKTLSAENMKLKDDLAFFENISPSAAGAEGISMQNFKIEPLNPNQFKFKVLVMQGGKSGRDFQGDMQLQLNVMQDGKAVTLLYPDSKAGDTTQLKLAFRHYQRMEGVVNIPAGAQLKSVQAKVLDKGVVRSQQTVNAPT